MNNYDIILIRFGEMTLKKKNYKIFLNKMVESIKRKCKSFKTLKYFHTDYRFYIYINKEDYQEVLKVLDTIPGLYSYSLCKATDPDFDKIASLGVKMLEEEMKGINKTFKVETNRSNKSFPFTSIQISQEVAKRILPNVEGLSVDVHNPDIIFHIDLRCEGTYVFVKEIKGLGGFPSDISGNGLLMMSGGLDSPVAGFLSIKKGICLKAIHYFSYPYTSLNALQKVVDLLQILATYTYSQSIELYVVPFTKIQDTIHEKANSIYMVTLMRRAMYKIATKICEKEKIPVIINGESIGQVASQTLESMRVVNDVTNIPIIRPLATYDKTEIIEIARKINTYEVSIRPYEDCCTVFVPEHPVINPNLDNVKKEELKCDMDELLVEAVNNTELIKLTSDKPYSVFREEKIDI